VNKPLYNHSAIQRGATSKGRKEPARRLTERPLQQNEVRQFPGRIKGVAHEHRWASVHQSRNEIPVLEPGIVVEVRSDLRPTLPPGRAADDVGGPTRRRARRGL
jgi:hypothetical protein